MLAVGIIGLVISAATACGVFIAAKSLYEARITRDVGLLETAMFKWASSEVYEARELCEKYAFGKTYREAVISMRSDDLPDYSKYKILLPLSVLESVAVLEKRRGNTLD